MAPTGATGERSIAQVVPLLKLRHLGNRRFDYLLPAHLTAPVTVGSVVSVPFGSRTVRAVVVGLDTQDEQGRAELRCIQAVEPEGVPADLMRLAGRLSERYLASYESCLRLVAPPRVPGRASSGVSLSVSRIVRTHAGARVKLTAKQERLVAAIPEEGVIAGEAFATAGVGAAVLRTLMLKGVLEFTQGPKAAGEPDPDKTLAVVHGPVLSEEQARAVEQLSEALGHPLPVRRQLWGVTGSGKTEVYLRLLERVVRSGGGAILLVPEIALTAQTIERVRERFGERVGELHSGLSQAKRRGEYARIARGEATVVVGARSAVFAPVAALRLVIVDESHDPSYKQEEEPRYHVTVAAELRLEAGGGLLLEGSATPAVESLADRRNCLRLTNRATGEMPVSTVIDMRRQGASGVLAPASREALAEVLRGGEQAIVLLNRRGFASYVHCENCGHVMICADCELSLTYHTSLRRLLCHHCGRAYAQPPLCPGCGAAPLVRGAPGTERLFDELRGLLAQGKVFRLDSDTLGSGARARDLLQEFSGTHPAVLMGTQMVAKGHDFPDVTLVVVADADTALYVPDFRAAERTFQLLTQVAGRAGRGHRPGRVVVQTWNPDVPCIRMALDRDEAGFYRRELSARRRLGYPPFTQLVRLLAVGVDAQRTQVGATHLARRLRPHFVEGELRGPARLPTLRGKSRWHILVAAHDGERARVIVGQAIAQLFEPYRRRGVVLQVDVDPISFG